MLAWHLSGMYQIASRSPYHHVAAAQHLPRHLVQVLPLGENKTQKVVAGDRTGVVHCFSVKKGEVVTSFKTLPTGQQVRVQPCISQHCSCGRNSYTMHLNKAQKLPWRSQYGCQRSEMVAVSCASCSCRSPVSPQAGLPSKKTRSLWQRATW